VPGREKIHSCATTRLCVKAAAALSQACSIR
jgi:hypothetical protein